MPDLTYEDLEKAIAPKSDQLNSVDLVSGDITVEILNITHFPGDKQRYHFDIEGYPGRPWKPCKTMLRLLFHIWSKEAKRKVSPSEWIGRSVGLYCDDTVQYGGKKDPGIRVNGLSHISKPYTLEVAITRGKYKTVTINPITTPALTAEEAKYVEVVSAELAAVSTLEELRGHGEMLKSRSKSEQNALRPVYAKVKRELESRSTDA